MSRTTLKFCAPNEPNTCSFSLALKFPVSCGKRSPRAAPASARYSRTRASATWRSLLLRSAVSTSATSCGSRSTSSHGRSLIESRASGLGFQSAALAVSPRSWSRAVASESRKRRGIGAVRLSPARAGIAGGGATRVEGPMAHPAARSRLPPAKRIARMVTPPPATPALAARTRRRPRGPTPCRGRGRGRRFPGSARRRAE